MSKRLGFIALAAYVATIFAANWAINRYGAVPVGFGLVAPAGVYFAGLTREFADHGEACGLELIDRLDLLPKRDGGRPQPKGRRQVHAHGRPSSLLVFQGRPRCRR